MKRNIYLLLGFLFVGLGMLGVFLPLLPTTPFLLLALWLFPRSSEKWKQWLLTNKIFGSYISDYHSGKGIPCRVKVYSLILLWATIGYGAIWCIDELWIRIMLGCIAAGVTIHILKIKTKRR